MKKILKIMVIIIIIIALAGVVFINLYQPFCDVYTFIKDDSYFQQTDLYDGTFHGDLEINVMSGKESQFAGEQLIPQDTVPVKKLDEILPANEDQLKWIWFGHSSSMLQMQGMNILIDPVFSEYSSPVSGFGPQRFSEVPIDLDDLPDIDMLVISHDHYDHLDYQTIKEIDDKVKTYCVPLGVEKHLRKWNVAASKIHTLAWWQDVTVNGLRVTAVPGRHYTGRLPWTKNTTLWCGFVFENEYYQTYYTGDTGYGDHFKEIHNRFGAMDLVILENGQYDNAWEAIHLLPEQGIQAIKDLEARWFVPVHWGTFSICNHAWDDPVQQITLLAQEQNLNVATPMIGEIVDYRSIENYQDHWWENIE